MSWRDAALADIAGLKTYWVRKHGWRPQVIEDPGFIDVFVRLRGRRLGPGEYVLRLRYEADWQTAGRREAFVNPQNHCETGSEFWPANNAVRGVNPEYRRGNGPVTPCICLRGVWGYHSILHPDQRPDGTTLLNFLLELQALVDE